MRLPNLISRIFHLHKWNIIDACKGMDTQMDKVSGKSIEQPRTIILMQCEKCGIVTTKRLEGFFDRVRRQV